MKKIRFLYLLAITPIIVSTPLFLLSCNKDSKLVSCLKKSNESYVAVIYNKEAKNLDDFEDIINSEQLKVKFKEIKDEFNNWWIGSKKYENELKNAYFKNSLLNGEDQNFEKLRYDLNGLLKNIENNIEIKEFKVKENIKDSKLYKETIKYLQNYFNDNFVKFFKSRSNLNDAKIIPGQSNKNRKEKIEQWINDQLKDENDFFFIYVRNGRIIKLKHGFTPKTSDDFNNWINETSSEFYSKDDRIYGWDEIYKDLSNKFQEIKKLT